MCQCVNVKMGSYDNQVTLPYRGKLVCIDRCVLPEVQELWRQDITTIESCCGHNITTGYIAVIKEHEEKMLAIGYNRHPKAPHVFSLKDD